MTDTEFVPPLGPPPTKAPAVPRGWKACWNEDYQEWFYVNIYTKKSQWELPTTEALFESPDDDLPPPGPPPGYTPNDPSTSLTGPIVSISDAKNNTYRRPAPNDAGPSAVSSSSSLTAAAVTAASATATTQEEEDERLARQLQEEENARARESYTRSDNPYTTQGNRVYGASFSSSSIPLPQTSSPPYDTGYKGKRCSGFLRKLLGKASGRMDSSSSSSVYHNGSYPGAQILHPAQGYCGGAPVAGRYSGGYYGGGSGMPAHPQQRAPSFVAGNPPRQRPGMGGMMGAGALGVGAGLLGGALVGNAISDAHMDGYEDGYQSGLENGGDFGGGDFGGDF